MATDIAARGIDIDQLPHVVNYELPNVPEDYVHRIGRTGRAGSNGEAVSLVCVDEHELLRNIEKFIKAKINNVVIESFIPDPSIEAEPIQNGRGGGGNRGRGGNNRGQSNRNANKNADAKKKKPRNKKPQSDEQKENKTPESNRKKPRNPAAEKIGSRLQEKLDNLDKKENRQKPKNNNRRK